MADNTIDLSGVVNTAITTQISSSTSSTVGWGSGNLSSFIITTGSLNITGTGTSGYKRPGARRKVKKKPGDKTGVNNQDLRLPLSPMVFFKVTKGKLGILEHKKLSGRIEKIAHLMEEFTKSGQVALKDIIENKFRPLIKEQEMFVTGFSKYITKELLQKFINKTNRRVELTAVKNYARIIPKKVLEIKTKADKHKLFDGYVILHTSSKDAKLLTEEERKDPILFGVLDKSDKFYFIADWEDELCDLRFSEIVDTLNLDSEDFKMENVDKELDKVLKYIKE